MLSLYWYIFRNGTSSSWFHLMALDTGHKFISTRRVFIPVPSVQLWLCICLHVFTPVRGKKKRFSLEHCRNTCPGSCSLHFSRVLKYLTYFMTVNKSCAHVAQGLVGCSAFYMRLCKHWLDSTQRLFRCTLLHNQMQILRPGPH